MINPFDYLHEKISEEGNGAILASGLFGGLITTVFLFDGSIESIIRSLYAMGTIVGSIVLKMLADDGYKLAKKHFLKYIKPKIHAKKRRNKAA